MTKGNIGVTTENIFPVIKKFLYSDHEIFLRELVSNAIDATQKLRTLSSVGEYKGELGDTAVEVVVDKEAGTLTVKDHGIGMTAEDIDKYINQIAFSGAEEFLTKYKDTANAIIGHFGLGFYSAFMVATKVEIHSLSYREGAEPVRWTCDGSPEYTMEAGDRSDRGTDIVLHIDDDSKEFLEAARIETLLKKYCSFLPVEVRFDGKVINATEPKWMKKPTELTDADYRDFYHELYPGQDDPLFWIHLNVDYPFTLTGILYFPKIKNNFEITKNRIRLYCNQVYVTDSVEGVVPEFMMLLQGVIDSPDIPLNVSRSYLQSDAAVKKISGYITKKVSSRLEELFKADRADFEKKWDDIKIFIEYGMLSDEKFCDSAMKFMLLKDTEGRHFTADEYKELVKDSQTDKDGNLVYLYANNLESQYNYIKAATDRGYDVLMMDGQLDPHFVGMLEQKLEKTHLVRVDADIIDNLIRKEEQRSVDLTASQRNILTTLLRSQLPKVEKAEFMVTFEALSRESMPIVLTQSEYMRRMKDMAALQPNMSFFGEMPDNYNLVVNTEHPLIAKIRDAAEAAVGSSIEPLDKKIADTNAAIADIKDESDEAKQRRSDLEKEVADARAEEERIISEYAAGQDLPKQLLDLALLANGLLRGESLSAFIARSVQGMM